MAIQVNYSPNLSDLGQASYGAGQRMGQYQSGQDMTRLIQQVQAMNIARQNQAIQQEQLRIAQEQAARAQKNQKWANIGKIGEIAASLGTFAITKNPLALAGLSGALGASREYQDDDHFKKGQLAKASQFRNNINQIPFPGSGYGNITEVPNLNHLYGR